MRSLKMEELGRPSRELFLQMKKHPLVLVLDNIRSMHNVGSIFRTADAFACTAIHICGYTARPPHPHIEKVALGATQTVAWEGFDTTVQSLQKLKQEGYKIYAAEQTTQSISLENFKWREGEKVAVILGNEVTGVNAGLFSYIDQSLEIPQWGTKHSLNVSVAAGILCWKLVETMRFR